ncbi:MAG: carboxylesterase/lipase family protein [Hyphomicrobium sp.]
MSSAFASSPRIWSGACFLALLLLPALAEAAAAGPIVATRKGRVEGVTAGGVTSFKGIPYAAPPIGERRWRDPVPAADWNGVRKASDYRPDCLQATPPPGVIGQSAPRPQSEDCLFLNVWTPNPKSGANLPVMAWIHGGAFVIGSGALDNTDGAALAKKGAVVVSFNYRLRQFGFFSHPAISANNADTTANFGLLDQIAALKWVKRNIANFGGDPGNVTIFGESAGAKSVLAQFASPLSRGLFDKGVAESSYLIPDMTRAKAVEMSVKVADALGLPGARATAKQLRAVPAEKIAALEGQGLTSAPVPISGDKVLPRSIEAVFRAGDQKPLPLIVGSNSDDSSVATAFGVDPAEVIGKIAAAGFVVKLLYPGVDDERERARQATRDLIFTMAARWTADRHAKLAPVWRYYFDYTAEKLRPERQNGVPHADEIPYVFNTVDRDAVTKPIATDTDRAYAETVSDYWFNFAKSGTPSAKGGPVWPRDTRFLDRTMIFADPIEARPNFMKVRLDIMIGLTKIIGAVAKPK